MELTATSPQEMEQRVEALRDYFESGTTRPYVARREALKALRASVKTHEEELLVAMHTDMRKPRFEAYMSDIGLVYAEIDHALKNLKEWMRPEAASTPLVLQVASSAMHREPLGVVLIIGPWNYPALLVLSPLVGALAAGNCAVLKPSNETPHTAVVIERIVADGFDPAHVTVVQGPGSSIGPHLIERFRFDHIFFTGSPAVGRKIMAMAAPHLTPLTLELGGKSPAIVDKDVDVVRAAKRIAWSKYFNAGQTCISTDHALVHTSVMDRFITAFAKSVSGFYGADPQQSPHFARLVNDRRFDMVKNYLGHGRVLLGGQHDVADRYIAPTMLVDVPLDSPPMREEIFGPALPVIPWTERDELLDIVKRNPFPLATYIFSNDKEAQRYFSERIAFGGGCINHTLLHFGNPELSFGGVGTSGMGRYHGRHSFELFSHHKGIVTASTLIDHGLQEPPYTTLKERILRRLLH